MPWFAWLVGAFVSVVGTFVGKALIALGIGFFVFTGIDMSLTWLKLQIVNNLALLPSRAVTVMGVLQVGTSINIMLSALSARLLLQGMTAGAIKRMGVK